MMWRRPIWKHLLTGGYWQAWPISLLSSASQKPDEKPFSLKVNVDLVILNVAVVDEKGANVTALRKEDFAVYEDDVEQEDPTFCRSRPHFIWYLLWIPASAHAPA